MGFLNENNEWLINEEQKIRITLSNRAKLTMAEDMEVFRTSKATTFINLVFDNFKLDAKSSISLYLQQLYQKVKIDGVGRTYDSIIKHEIQKLVHVVRTGEKYKQYKYT